MNDDKKYLTELQFYKWKINALILQIADLKYQLGISTRASNATKMEVERYKHELTLRSIEEKSNAIEKAKNNFSEYRKELEEEVGVDLSNKVIDNITFEIKEID